MPEDQRLTLAHKLLTANEPHISDDVEKAWDVEIRNRIKRYNLGRAILVQPVTFLETLITV